MMIALLQRIAAHDGDKVCLADSEVYTFRKLHAAGFIISDFLAHRQHHESMVYRITEYGRIALMLSTKEFNG